MIVGIIGAGASGMAAALAAAKNENVTVVLLERQARVGRKLLATGNGRCNLTNTKADRQGYHGEDPGFSKRAIDSFTPQDTIEWFSQMGLYTVQESSGRVYPYSDQANSVVDVLRLALARENVELKTGFEVTKIRKTQEGFTVESAQDSVFCHKLIVACGGLAGTKLGGSMSGYKLLGKLGHRSTRLRPTLVQLRCGWEGVVSLKGVRANCHVQILHNGAVYNESVGEIQFTEYGLSGPVIFEVSRDVCYEKGTWTAKLDLLPQWTEEKLRQELENRRQWNVPMEELLTGILHNRLGRVLTRLAGVKGKNEAAELSEEELSAVCACVKGFEMELTEPLGMDSAQVTAGGVITADFDPATLESKLIAGLYACGEVLDVDGDCGGYNLQWAWSSGYCAGSHAGKEL